MCVWLTVQRPPTADRRWMGGLSVWFSLTSPEQHHECAASPSGGRGGVASWMEEWLGLFIEERVQRATSVFSFVFTRTLTTQQFILYIREGFGLRVKGLGCGVLVIHIHT